MIGEEIMFTRHGFTVGDKVIVHESSAIRTEVTVTKITRNTMTLTDADGKDRIVQG